MSAPDESSPGSRPRVALLFGGRSSEHAISCVSAGSVLAAIDRTAWDVVAIGITREGRWTLASDDPDAWRLVDGVLPEVDGSGAPYVLSPDPGASPGERVDLVFPLLHGPFGEDGTVQGLLELAGLPYVGSGVLASAAAMDKDAMKALLTRAGLPVGPYVTITPADWAADSDAALRRVVETLELPVFVKPARAGSSVGISKVSDIAGLRAAVEAARAHDPKVVVEQGIAGREIECGVLARDGVVSASVPAEIRVGPEHEFYDFEAKYVDGAELDVPADLPAAVVEDVRALSLRAFDALGCEGLARVDFFLADGDRLVVNEVNTMPGFTPTSMFPRMWGASGVDYAALVDALLRAALARPTGLR